MWQRMSFVLLMLISTYFLKDDRFITFYIGPFVLGFSVFYLMIKRLNLIECMVYAILASLNIYYFVGSHWFIASAFALFFISFDAAVPLK